MEQPRRSGSDEKHAAVPRVVLLLLDAELKILRLEVLLTIEIMCMLEGGRHDAIGVCSTDMITPK